VNDDELAHTIATLRADYAKQLPATVTQMEDLWRRIVSGESPLSRLAELARMAHSITGAGATFGLPGASSAARELELFLEQIGDSGQLPGAAEQARVAAQFAELRLAASQQTPGI
jgi:hypothetical protein